MTLPTPCNKIKSFINLPLYLLLLQWRKEKRKIDGMRGKFQTEEKNISSNQKAKDKQLVVRTIDLFAMPKHQSLFLIAALFGWTCCIRLHVVQSVWLAFQTYKSTKYY